MRQPVRGHSSDYIKGMSSPQQPPHLTPASLFEDQAKLDAIRLQVYNRLLSAVHQKIKFASTQTSAGQMTSFDVPEWQPGCPRFDVKDCILYIVWNLRHAGFQVMYVPSNRLLISWKEQSIQYYQEDSPIRQAMVAAASQGAVPPPSKSQKPEKKKAGTYKPTAEGVAGMLAQGGIKKSGASTITFI
jgi:hypothetical protein